MMVPMMVPQDAVSQIAAGYPAAHQSYPAAATSASFASATTMTTSPHHPLPFFTNMATPHHPWMGAGGNNMTPSSTAYHTHHPSATTSVVGVPGMQLGQQQQNHHQQLQHGSLPPPLSQLHQLNNYQTPSGVVGLSNVQPSGDLHSMTPSATTASSEASGATIPPIEMARGNNGGNERTVHQQGTTTQVGQPHHSPPPPPHTLGTVVDPRTTTTHQTSSQPSLPTDTSTEPSMIMATYPTQMTHHVAPTFVPAFQMHPQQFLPTSHGAHPTLIATPHVHAMQTSHAVPSYYPSSSSQGHDALSTVMMNYPNQQHVHANPAATAGAPTMDANASYSSSFAVNDASASPAHPRQQQQQPSPLFVQQQHDESEKPLVRDTTSPQSGGGNLAHCA